MQRILETRESIDKHPLKLDEAAEADRGGYNTLNIATAAGELQDTTVGFSSEDPLKLNEAGYVTNADSIIPGSESRKIQGAATNFPVQKIQSHNADDFMETVLSDHWYSFSMPTLPSFFFLFLVVTFAFFLFKRNALIRFHILRVSTWIYSHTRPYFLGINKFLSRLRIRRRVPGLVKAKAKASEELRDIELLAPSSPKRSRKLDSIFKFSPINTPVTTLPKLICSPNFRSILTDAFVKAIVKNLPSYLLTRNWKLAYSAEVHGYSLQTAYANMNSYSGPFIMVLMDENRHVFGAFGSEPLRCRAEYYGTGETFIFQLHPRSRFHRWSGMNECFLASTSDIICFGGGRSAFMLDNTLDRGHANKDCETFTPHERLSLKEDFRCCAVEMWSFTSFRAGLPL